MPVLRGKAGIETWFKIGDDSKFLCLTVFMFYSKKVIPRIDF